MPEFDSLRDRLKKEKVLQAIYGNKGEIDNSEPKWKEEDELFKSKLPTIPIGSINGDNP